ncbi:MAG: efflux RND transporter periplasmic adaptor subunit [Calditrichia bacterium]
MKNRILKGMKYMLNLSLLLIFTFVMTHCSNDNKTPEAEKEAHSGEEHAEEVVKLSPEEIKEFGIEIATAGPGMLEQHVDLTGEIVIDPRRLAHLTPRFPGIIKEVRKTIGDPVKKGEVLAVIESNESLSPYEIKSLIDGQVIDMHLTQGEVVTDESHAFTIADLSKVWADLSVYQKDLPHIQLGQKVYISAGPNTREVDGTISYISPVVDEKTRTTTARVVLENPDGHWRPGLFVTGRVIIGTETVPVYAPKTALETFENRTVVFVKNDEGFEPQPVTIGRSNTKAVEIVAGLKPGQQYVSKGGFTLKAELQKESFGEGDSH